MPLSRALPGLVFLAGLALAQPPKPPALPAVDPAAAKLGRVSESLGTPVRAVAYLDGKGLLAAGEDRVVRFWPREEGKDLLAPDTKPVLLKGHVAVITALVAAGGTVGSGDSAGKVLLWAPPADKPVRTIDTKTAVRALALSPDGKVLVSAGDDGTVQMWDPATGTATRKITGPADGLLAVALSADGKTVAAGGYDGKLWCWDLATGNKKFDVAVQPPGPPQPNATVNVIAAVAFAPDGKTIAAGGSDARVFLFTADGKFARQMQGHTGAITALEYHPAGVFLLSGSADRTVRLWELTKPQPPAKK
jgi:WD40 repeat protein